MVNPFLTLINSYLPEPEASLMVGMLFGKVVKFPDDFYQALITTGTIHVVSLSGMNISILINMVGKAGLIFGRKLGSLLSILAVVAFILFVGPSPSIIRAGIMGSLSLIALFTGRQYLGLLGLILAGSVMVVYDIGNLSNLSFQLSFLATAGIIIFAPAQKSQRIKQVEPLSTIKIYSNYIKKVLRDNFTTTLAAQVGTLPVIAFAFGRISLVSPLTNVLVGWTVYPIMILGILLSVAGLLYQPIGLIFAWAAYPLLRYFVFVVETTSKIPYASLFLR